MKQAQPEAFKRLIRERDKILKRGTWFKLTCCENRRLRQIDEIVGDGSRRFVENFKINNKAS
jgi:hypothetical protein